jgi:flagellar biosynthesis protein FlhF
MMTKKFYASSPREALSQIRREFGDDAEIISNRIVNGRVEIIAKQGEPDTQKQPPNKNQASIIAQAEPTPTGIEKMLDEIRELKNGFYKKLDNLLWTSSKQLKPAQNIVLERVLAAGFSPSLARRLVEKLPNDYSDSQAIAWLREILSRNLSAEIDEQSFLSSARVIALVGPTGVGKTTTIAKMAARYVMSHGADKLAFITTDSYRIGALEQLKVFGSILGVSVHAVKDHHELQLTLEHLHDRKSILIDTPGMCQRDKRVDAQMAMFDQISVPIKRILCLNATNQIETTNDVVNVYAKQSIEGCIITKVDEAITLGSVLNVVMQHKLKVCYVTNGQRVPEDIELIDKAQLFERVITDKKISTDLSDVNETAFQTMFKQNAPAHPNRVAAYA